MYACIHACIHACIRTCIHTCIHAYILHTHTYILACIHTCMHTKYIHTYILHTYVHTYIVCVCVCVCVCVIHLYIYRVASIVSGAGADLQTCLRLIRRWTIAEVSTWADGETVPSTSLLLCSCSRTTKCCSLRGCRTGIRPLSCFDCCKELSKKKRRHT